jgi:hypothetical protein
MYTVIPNFQFENYFSPQFCIKIYQNLHMELREMVETPLKFLIKLSFESALYSSLGAGTFKTMLLHQ